MNALLGLSEPGGVSFGMKRQHSQAKQLTCAKPMGGEDLVLPDVLATLPACEGRGVSAKALPVPQQGLCHTLTEMIPKEIEAPEAQVGNQLG